MLVFLFASCASTRIVPMATIEQDMFAKKFKSPTNKSILYLIRPNQFHARNLNFSVVVDKLVIGILKDRSYAVLEVPPGKHFISVPGSFEGDCILKINAEQGKLHFVKMSIGGGWSQGTMFIENVNEDEGKALVNECDLIDPI
jgi:hypothetical protein